MCTSLVSEHFLQGQANYITRGLDSSLHLVWEATPSGFQKLNNKNIDFTEILVNLTKK